MPIVAFSPSSFTHSCSLLYSRSSGCAKNFSLLCLFRALVKWQRYDGRLMLRAAYLDLQPRALGCGRFFDERRRDVLVVDRGRDRAAADRADGTPFMPDRVTLARRNAPTHHHTHDAGIVVALDLPFERFFTEKLRLGSLDGPTEASLNRRDRLG